MHVHTAEIYLEKAKLPTRILFWLAPDFPPGAMWCSWLKEKGWAREEPRPRHAKLLGICPWKNFGNLIRRKWGVAKKLIWLPHRKPADGGTARRLNW